MTIPKPHGPKGPPPPACGPITIPYRNTLITVQGMGQRGSSGTTGFMGSSGESGTPRIPEAMLDLVIKHGIDPTSLLGERADDNYCGEFDSTYSVPL